MSAPNNPRPTRAAVTAYHEYLDRLHTWDGRLPSVLRNLGVTEAQVDVQADALWSLAIARPEYRAALDLTSSFKRP